MDKSTYLKLFDREKPGEPYSSGKEFYIELKALLIMLLTVMEKYEAGAVAPDFAERDISMAGLHIESRYKASSDQNIDDIISKFELNRAEVVVFLFALSNEDKWIREEAFPRLFQGRRGVSLSFALEVCNFLNMLKPENESFARNERLREFLSSAAGKDLSYEPQLKLRQPILKFIYRERFEEADKKAKRALEPVYIYKDYLKKLELMCNTENADWTLCISGDEGSGKKFLLRHLAEYLNKEIHFIDGDKIIKDNSRETKELISDIKCYLKLSEELICLVNGESIYPELREAVRGLLLVTSDKAEWSEVKDNFVTVKLPYPTAKEKALLWQEFLKEYPHEDSILPDSLGSKYVLNAGGIKKILYAAHMYAKGAGRAAISDEDIIFAVTQSQAGQLGSYAALVPCVFGWEDLIVEEKVKTQLNYICSRIKYRSLVGNQWGFYSKMPYGKGICALFYGPPGTGKTMAVQVIARELGLELYRVDLSQMVSKYIGETEKNISALFDKARHMNVVLFFDEADAFFSKRSEVKDSNDRSANGEIAHLLQKLEEYDGISILATNLKENMDDAFKRRIQFMVNFRLPSAEVRKMLWHRLIPKEAPVEDNIDLDFFAEHFELSGSQIKEIILGAAFIAAEKGCRIGNSQIKEAVCINFEKYGKMLTEKDFGYLGR